MDIDEKLNNIIMKYNLDKHYPTWRPYLKAQKIIKKFLGELKEPTAFVALNYDEICYLERLVNPKVEHDFILLKEGTMQLFNLDKAYERYIITEKDMDILSSYRNVISVAITEDPTFLPWLSYRGIDAHPLQELCLDEGVYIEDYISFLPKKYIEKGSWLHQPHSCLLTLEYINLDYCYNQTEYTALKKIYLERMFFLTLLLRDFPQAFKLSEKLTDEYKSVVSEISELLNEIEYAIKNKKRRDILLFWIDAVSKKDSKSMPFITDLAEKNVDFIQSFSVTPMTRPSYRTIFCEKKVLDDKSYNIETIDENNSPVLRDCLDMGYDFLKIGHYRLFAEKYETSYFLDLYASAGNLLWNLLRHLLSSNNPTMYLTHFLVETHPPCLSIKLNKNSLFNHIEERKLSRLAIDELLSFYDRFWASDTVKLFFSDHGFAELPNRLHTFCILCGNDYGQRKIDSMFSHIDFVRLLKGILKGEKEPWLGLTKEYVEFQDLPLYNKNLIGGIIKNKAPILNIHLGYRGIITAEYIYIYFSTGREILCLRNDFRDIYIIPTEADIVAPDKLPYFRKLAKVKPGDALIDDPKKLRYSKYLLQVYDNIIKENQRKVEVINAYFDGFPNKSVSIRSGGHHSLMLYYCLSIENRKKIAYFIDKNKDCECKKLGFPIVALDEADFTNIKEVILSSFQLRDVLKEEARSYSDKVKVSDIYDIFSEAAIYCNGDFFLLEASEDAYDVDFPFHEKKRADEIINAYFDKLPNKSVGIRSGGLHSFNLYYSLLPKNREKLAYFIDKNKDCKCKEIGLPIVALEEADFTNMKEVILSSFILRDVLIEEAKSYADKVKATDIYDIFSEGGLDCYTDFFLLD